MDWVDAAFLFLIVCGLFAVMLVVGVGSSYLGLIWLNKQATKCPECGKIGAGELVESKLINSVSRVEQKTRSGIFRKKSRPVRVAEETYEDHFECQYCGHRWMRTAQWDRTIPKKKKNSIANWLTNLKGEYNKNEE